MPHLYSISSALAHGLQRFDCQVQSLSHARVICFMNMLRCLKFEFKLKPLNLQKIRGGSMVGMSLVPISHTGLAPVFFVSMLKLSATYFQSEMGERRVATGLV